MINFSWDNSIDDEDEEWLILIEWIKALFAIEFKQQKFGSLMTYYVIA